MNIHLKSDFEKPNLGHVPLHLDIFAGWPKSVLEELEQWWISEK